MLNLPKKELYLLVMYLRVLKLCEEFMNLSCLHVNIHSDFFFPEYVPQKGAGDSQHCWNSSHTFLKVQRLVVMTTGGELSKDQRFGMVRTIIEKPECYNARNS